MVAWLKTYATTHLFYIILIVVGAIAFYSWKGEHDQRLIAEQTIKANSQVIAGLNDQIKARDAANVAADNKVKTLVAATKTPAQVVAAIPRIAPPDIAGELNARVSPTLPNVVEVDAPGLIDLTGKFVTMSQDLATCRADYADETKKFNTDESTIATLKKKPRLIKRIFGSVKTFGIGVGVGVVLAAKVGL